MAIANAQLPFGSFHLRNIGRKPRHDDRWCDAHGDFRAGGMDFSEDNFEPMAGGLIAITGKSRMTIAR